MNSTEIKTLKTNIEAMAYLIEQIAICEHEMQTTEDAQCLHDMSRQRSKFIESLTKVKEQLGFDRIKELEHQLYLSDFRTKKYNRNNEFESVEREQYEKMLIQKELNELKAKL